jgi:hypothetical protein
MFLVSKGDKAELKAVKDSDSDYCLMPEKAGPGDYARKMNSGIEHSDEDWIFLGADDLCFCLGWLDRAVACAEVSGKRVIGTNDLGNSAVLHGRHSTHTLVARSYTNLGSLDGPKLLHEGYDHNYVDVEFIETAKARGEFHPCRQSHVEHLHPFWHKGQDDSTYARGRSGYARDGELWRQRSKLLTITPRMGGAVTTA